ncbi:MAG: DedA family protein [Patescibacteria group bacterium]
MQITEFINQIEVLYLIYGYILVFLSSFVEISPLGFTIPGGLILALGGFYSFGGPLNLLVVILFAWFGGWLIFVLAYYLGRQTGFWLVKVLKQEKNAARAKHLLNKHGGVILTTSLMSSLTRFLVAYVAGTQKYNFFKFFFYSGVASLTWSSLWVVIGFLAGSERVKLENAVAGLGVLAWGFLILALVAIYLKNKKEFKEFKEVNGA